MANGFLRKRREEEYNAKVAAEQPKEEESKKEDTSLPIVGPVLSAPMGGRIICVNVKPGDKVKTQ